MKSHMTNSMIMFFLQF